MAKTEPNSDPSSERGFFLERHIGTSETDRVAMLEGVGIASMAEHFEAALPSSIRDDMVLDLPAATSERELLAEITSIANANDVVTSMIGLGYSDSILPAVIRRMILENPSWYTAYTPYQAEISQGRLETLLTFQTMVADLAGLPLANASLLDEATAVVEAMLMCARFEANPTHFVVDRELLPQTIAVLETRARPLGIEIVIADLDEGLPAVEAFGVALQYPGERGRVRDPHPLIDAAHDRGWRVVVAADILALTVLTPPGELGADVVVGSTQRFGLPLGFGGPHAGYLASSSALARAIPGRIIGVSRDVAGGRALQLALQTREQHIRREKATSNICTAEVLPAVVAAMFAVHHGPDGLTAIAERVHGHALELAKRLIASEHHLVHEAFFDTIAIRVPGRAGEILSKARQAGINLRMIDPDTVAIACDESTTAATIDAVSGVFGASGLDTVSVAFSGGLPRLLRRRSKFLTNQVFHRYRSEASLTRYIRRLSDLDLALDRTMIPLGSCTMKLNAAVEMETITWPHFASLHPFAPVDQTTGTRRIISDLERWLAEITGYEAVSIQPNAGSQGEIAGLLAIRSFHEANGEGGRDVCLVPSSAHGTNPASARLSGMRVVTVACDGSGNVDLEDLRAKLAQHGPTVSTLMITYPSTSGIYEPAIRTICDLVHEAGGQVYLDGANLNALVGVVRPGQIGADASHLNLHKTFCIPHGGGGPGVGPIAVKAHLAPYLPNHPLRTDAGPESGIGPISAAPFGSAGILTIPWMYVRLMGGVGLRHATEAAVLSANYLANALAPYFPVLYRDDQGRVAHECIIDVRPFTSSSGVTAEDVAKRLIDYGFHAPTMSFPVAGTLMIEPTESEGIEELDRFVAAMASIRNEIDDVVEGRTPRDDNPMINAPHTAEEIAGEWAHAYSREAAAYPVDSLRSAAGWVKYWSPIKRVDVAFGDRNLAVTLPSGTGLIERRA
ncbi:MAG TPA: aminomethyl-transferring glycine dehydrogenase [Acidimicrobiales bacterium]|nr:aminomethyl-transferring glycine dehydrogenase [Acidimicrobiales bacterium]